MLPRRLLSVFLALAAFASGLTAQHVTASLVATEASVQSGRPITVAIRLEHDAHWHTYWLNPGTGYPTSIAWQLPPGWTAGAGVPGMGCGGWDAGDGTAVSRPSRLTRDKAAIPFHSGTKPQVLPR